MSLQNPAAPQEFNQAMRDKILALGATPVVSDLDGALATNRLWRQLLSRLGGANATQSFIFRPGAVAPLENGVYNDWALLYTDAVNAPGPVVIFLDDSIVTPLIIPAGNWDFPRRDVALVGADFELWTFVVLADNVTLNGVGMFDNLLDITQQNTSTPVISLNTGVFPFPIPATILGLGTNIHNIGTQPFFEVAADTFAAFALITANIDANTVNVIDALLGFTFALLASFDGAFVAADAARSTGVNTIVQFQLHDASRDVDFANQPNFLGTVLTDFIEDASRMQYVAANAADWNGTPPTTVAEALDRIAAFTGPIP